ncbi:hypothetical protein JOD57_001202 [Geodermatophilus bullaregiensis]|uniref:hypothetical protein n=1 Tax=Geodermatophilus bullaregiensis TaxID=1564160 RepID=UPI0019563BC1|nr:hypothetical protein [Geodermatophilus bullaregiensis]MBM7805365.1 hypothetical protein [Geodermatophilus bullaregiensis]
MTAPERAPDAQRRTATAVGARGLRTPITWGVVRGCLQAASPLAFSWLDDATVHALGLVLIAVVSIGFGVADGRGRVIAVDVVAALIAAGIVADVHLGW